jgi:hypothetical protein
MASTISAGTTSGTAIAITGDTTGNLAFQTSAGTYTQTMPNGTGNIVVNGVNSPIVSATAVASTSGTSIDFTSIPSWVKRITVMFNGVSTNGSSLPIIRLGASGGIETTGYLGSCSRVEGSSTSSLFTDGFGLQPSGAAAIVFQGAVTISNISGNAWVASGVTGSSDFARCTLTGGSKTTATVLDRLRITTQNGTDTFDAGSINIQYE